MSCRIVKVVTTLSFSAACAPVARAIGKARQAAAKTRDRVENGVIGGLHAMLLAPVDANRSQDARGMRTSRIMGPGRVVRRARPDGARTGDRTRRGPNRSPSGNAAATPCRRLSLRSRTGLVADLRRRRWHAASGRSQAHVPVRPSGLETATLRMGWPPLDGPKDAARSLTGRPGGAGRRGSRTRMPPADRRTSRRANRRTSGEIRDIRVWERRTLSVTAAPRCHDRSHRAFVLATG